MREPDFFVVGAPKAATSALFAHLRRHPEIFMPALKEPQFFGRDQHHLGHSRRTPDEYLALFEGAGRARRVGEASTNYLYSATAAEEISAFAPDAAIIVMLRDPVAIMHAYHATMVAGGFEPIRHFARALEAETERRHGRLLPDRSGLRESLYYRHIADLPAHVERYFRVFGRERVHVILFDEWRSDEAGVYRETLRFLDVDDSFVPSFEVVNDNRTIRSNRIHDFVLEPPKPLSAAARALLPPPVRSRWRHGLLGLNTRRAAREPIEPGLLRELRAEFAPVIARLAELIERDLSAWEAVEATPHLSAAPAVEPTSSVATA
jgi:hypothetical protein